MEAIITYVIAVILFAAIFFIFTVRGKARRQRQKSGRKIYKLKKGRTNHQFETALPFEHAHLSRIKYLLEKHNFRIIDGVDDGIIAYSGKNEDAALYGWRNIDPLLLPFRVVVTASAAGTILVKFSDDYGFQMLTKDLNELFAQKYMKVFSHYEAALKAS